ncbi:MAG: hypothetical protein LBS17_03480 [Actinomycetes bacterium]|nr:hypothetical protein [Actinomycetes bacterium]
MKTSMSTPRRVIKKKFYAKAGVVIEHLLKLALFPGVQSSGKWKQSIYAAIYHLALDKGNRLPSYEFMYDEVELKKCFDSVPREYEYGGVTKRVTNWDNAFELVKGYFDWLTTELAYNRVLSRQEAYDTIDCLIDVWNI